MIRPTPQASSRRSSGCSPRSGCDARWGVAAAGWRGSASAWTKWSIATSRCTTRCADRMLGKPRRLAVLAEGRFSALDAKTAVGVLRYRPDEVAAVLDSTRAGRTTESCVGLGGTTPVVATLAAAAAAGADSLL